MQHLDWGRVEETMLTPGFYVKFIHSGTMTFAQFRIDVGAALPAHSHPHEQVTQVLEGTFELTVDGVTRTLTPGNVVIIPPHAAHSGKAVTPCLVLDTFHPRREDYVRPDVLHEIPACAGMKVF